MSLRMKSLAWTIVLTVVIGSWSHSHAAQSSSPLTKSVSLDAELIISGLLDQRLQILTEYPDKTEQLHEVDDKLRQAGVTFLSPLDVDKHFTLADDTLTYTHTGPMLTDTPDAVPPSSSYNTWMSYRIENYYFDGAVYNVQKLVAQPQTNQSRLVNIGGKTIAFENNWTAGVENIMKSISFSAAGIIPGASYAISFYDAVSAYASGISRTTEVNAQHVSYSWSSKTTAVFTYVRRQNQTDSEQRLMQISTKTYTSAGYQMPSFTYRKESGSWVYYPSIIQAENSFESKPVGYDTIDNAILRYKSGNAHPIHYAVSSINIYGPISKIVQTIYPCYPQFPIHCE